MITMVRPFLLAFYLHIYTAYANTSSSSSTDPLENLSNRITLSISLTPLTPLQHMLSDVLFGNAESTTPDYDKDAFGRDSAQDTFEMMRMSFFLSLMTMITDWRMDRGRVGVQDRRRTSETTCDTLNTNVRLPLPSSSLIPRTAVWQVVLKLC